LGNNRIVTHMQNHHAIVAIIIAVIIVGSGLLGMPLVFANRVTPGITLGSTPLVGIPHQALSGVVAEYERQLLKQPVELVVRETRLSRPLGAVGIAVNREATVKAILRTQAANAIVGRRSVVPEFTLSQAEISTLADQEFASVIKLPQNATLTLTPGRGLTLVPSATGEAIDVTTLAADLQWRARHNDWQAPIELAIVSSPASVHEGETLPARAVAEELLREGLVMSDGATTWTMEPYTVTRLLRFIPIDDPAKAGNQILGVTFDAEETRGYLATTIAPEVNQPAINARFERVENLVTQFAVPQAGKDLNVDGSVASLQQALLTNHRPAPLVIAITEPAIQDTADIEALGIKELLATGTSDYAGSPSNRIHNILEGTKRYHGLLVSPGQDFSFNEFLGPVDGAHGFKPELVIKKNVTIPEFGGGLCQVSTTLFRAATHAGLEITQRRNHAYAVRYYGTPGFDATIYPPYTDLRFTNNTPGYILIQTRVEGTHLAFELWGTNDNREVVVDGPHPYGRTPDGAVKATLTQKVTRNGELLIDDTFYSRYQSPNLFPKQASNATTPPPPAPISPNPT
jgi:vancomycin resistance protein YoaR